MGADLTRIYAEGICFFHGVDAKNVGATGTSPLRYQNIHLTMVVCRGDGHVAPALPKYPFDHGGM
jgi:hypothetical protein